MSFTFSENLTFGIFVGDSTFSFTVESWLTTQNTNERHSSPVRERRVFVVCICELQQVFLVREEKKNNECWLWQCEKQILPALFTFSRELECGKFDHHQLLRKTWAGLVLQIVQQNIQNESLFWPDVKMCRTSKMWNQAASADKRENISLFLRFYVALFSLAREIRNLFGIDICRADVTDLVHHDLATTLIDQ